jgi:dTDP-4-dehydrorhamnose 3,5-epimerase
LDEKQLTPVITKLEIIENPKGNIRRILKSGSENYSGFGEAYFTSIDFGLTKGWKRHLKMHMNLVVPVGMVKFHTYDGVNYSAYEIGEHKYMRLTIPPGIWVAFTGTGISLNLILNIASIEHDPKESEYCCLEEFAISIK